MIHAAVVLVAATGLRCASVGWLWHVAIIGVMGMVVRMRRVAMPVGVRVVVLLLAMRVQAPLGQPKASQADRTDAQPQPHVAHLGRYSPGTDPAKSPA
jgi:hypothetical protein